MAKVRSQKTYCTFSRFIRDFRYIIFRYRTAHLRYELLNLNRKENPTKESWNCTSYQRVLLVCDGCIMNHKRAFEALDRTLKDIRKKYSLMSGIPELLFGDFRQILTVILKGTRWDEIRASLKSCKLCRHVYILKLTTDSRAYIHWDITSNEFSETLLTLGEERVPFNS